MCEPKDVPRRPAIPSSLVALVLVIVLMRCQLCEGTPWLGGASGRVSALIALTCIVAALMCAFARHDDAALTAQLTSELKAIVPGEDVTIVIDHNYSES